MTDRDYPVWLLEACLNALQQSENEGLEQSHLHSVLRVLAVIEDSGCKIVDGEAEWRYVVEGFNAIPFAPPQRPER